ncbi:MAG: hypothetical protein FWH42_05945, partial [Dehalococcoidia bacterium]|nr:hypothetical protein [Dehalococcoidia bacterium]
MAGEDMVNGSNMYAYCNGNPVMYVDPSGRAVDIGSILNGFLNLLLIGLTWLAKAFSDFFTSGAFLQAWEGFLKIGKSIDIFKENP